MMEQITYYLQGRLTEKGSLDFWEHLLVNEKDLEIMTIYWMLRQYFAEELRR